MFARIALAFVVLSAGAFALRVNKPQKRSEDPTEPIFYMIAMDKLASKHQSRLWFASVRQVGQWKGKIVVTTDKPDCLAKNLGENLLGGGKIAAESSDTVHVYPGGEGLGKIYLTIHPETHNVMEMKRQKTEAFNYAKKVGLQPRYIVYTDQDILMGQNFDKFFEEVNKMAQDPPTVALFKDKGSSKGQLHTGVMVFFNTPETATCLADWSKAVSKRGGLPLNNNNDSNYKGLLDQAALESGLENDADDISPKETSPDDLDVNFSLTEVMGQDQKAFASVKSCRAGKGITLLSTELLLMPDKKSLSKGESATFLHFTNTNRWQHIDSNSKKTYFSKLGLGDVDYEGYEQC